MKRDYSLSSCKQKIEWLTGEVKRYKGINAELLEACKIALNYIIDTTPYRDGFTYP